MQPDPRFPPGRQQPSGPPVTGWWFLVPLLTCGLGTAPMVLAGAVRLRSRLHLYLAAGYFAAFIITCASSALLGDDPGALAGAVVSIAYFLVWIVGTIHVAFLAARIRAGFFQNQQPGQPPVYGRSTQRPGLSTPARAKDHRGLGHYPPPPPAWQQRRVDPALAEAQWRAARREESRRLQATQPAVAAELMIGRPDLPGRRYDDGGLIDVNHLPADWLSRGLGIERHLADRIVAARDLHNGFASPEELIVYCDGLTPAKLDLFRDRLIFIPR